MDEDPGLRRDDGREGGVGGWMTAYSAEKAVAAGASLEKTGGGF